MNNKKWTFIPKLKATTMPKQGGVYEIYRGFWWALTKDEEIILFRQYGSPQCNMVKSITERIMECKGHPGTHAEQLDAVFLQHDCGEYV